MSVLAFDTHEAVLALKQAGFAEGQAEAVVTTMGAALGGQVATKADLAEVRAALEQLRLTTQADLAEVRTALEAALEQLRSETKADLAVGRAALETLRADTAEQFATLYKQLWLMAVGIITLTVSLTVSLVKLLP